VIEVTALANLETIVRRVPSVVTSGERPRPGAPFLAYFVREKWGFLLRVSQHLAIPVEIPGSNQANEDQRQKPHFSPKAREMGHPPRST